MSKIKTMGASPLSGSIFYGTLDTDKGRWVGQKTDVTEIARRAVAEHLYQTGDSHTYELKDGRQLVLSVEIREAK
ncbi:DUF7446 family protein [Serratia proteamaculans]|uniref:DUF7446 family protein n=1 Tax=Serratia proteamaculans TaxID=28151 RepID=UPI002981F646|nr:hypothetical protein [Serratia proteamaculans]MDW5511768.1 hypothetical protein [Serratia proteamaculans]